MPISHKLRLPYLPFEVTPQHLALNRHAKMLDVLAQIAVLDRDLSDPPLFPSEGDSYLVGPSPSPFKAWAGKAGQIAVWLDDEWEFFAPSEGWLLWVADEDRLLVYNGAAWVEPIPRRELLTAGRTYYVDPATGSDGNNGLAPNTAFHTIQRAIDAALNVDPNGHTVQIQLADGTYTSGGRVSRPMFDGSQLTILGNLSQPANVHITTPGGNAFLVDCAGAKVRIEGVKFSGDVGVWARFAGVVFLTGKNAFGACGFRHISCDNSAFIEMLGGQVSIEGAAPHHLYADAGGHIFYALGTTTISGTPNFPFGFAYAQSAALITSYGMTFNGSATGPRYQATLNGVINVNGAGPDYFPGNDAGVLASGAQYA